MAGGKLSARQKMINMMYLVLTALLALNVSKEIIKAFNLIENSLDKSTQNLDQANNQIIAALAKDGENPGAKAAKKYAEEVASYAKVLTEKLNSIKTELLVKTGDGKDPKMGRKQEPEAVLVPGGVPELAQGDNMEVHANYFVVENEGQRGKELLKLINDTRTKMLGVLTKASNDPLLGKDAESKKFLQQEADKISQKTTLYASEKLNANGTPEWVGMYLEHSPLGGVFVMLSKLENDARALEKEINTLLAQSVNATDFKFDKTIAVVSAKTGAVLTNQTYEADILLAAYDSRKQMSISVNGRPIEVVDGVGKYKVTSATPGGQKYKVTIAVPKPGGGSTNIETEAEYSVFAPQAAISADELNVFYVGLPNPISVSVGGVDPKNVQVVASGGGVILKPNGAGKYFATLPTRNGNECIVKVTAKLPDGRTVSMGEKKFKIRNVPKPTFKLGGIGFAGDVSLSGLRIQSEATAPLENFVYDGVKYNVMSFKFSCLGRTIGYKEQMVNGKSLSAIQGYLGGLKPGDKIFFEQIRVVGPDNIPKFLDNVSATLSK